MGIVLSPLFFGSMTALTFYVLLGDDLRQSCFEKDADQVSPWHCPFLRFYYFPQFESRECHITSASWTCKVVDINSACLRCVLDSTKARIQMPPVFDIFI